MAATASLTREQLFETLADHVHRRQLAVFCGAGISMDPPTSLPSWRALTDAMLDAVGEASGEPSGQSFAKNVKEAQLPPELIAGKLQDIFGDEFFNSLDVLKTGEPNLNHLYLASLAKTGYLPVIVTANFDTFIEKALRALEVPFRVFRRDEEFAAYLEHGPAEGETTLIKIHGCIDAKDTIIATLKDTGRGLANAKKQVLQSLLEHYFFLFLGYSGNDFNLDDNKLAMRDAQDKARGFFWNFRPGETNPVVEGLIADYAGRGHRIEHLLPDLLVDLQMRVGGSVLEESMRRWATKLKPEHFRVLGELLHHAGHLDDAKLAYEMHGKQRNDAGTRRMDARRRGTMLHNLGRLAADRGEYAEAQDLYSRALGMFEQLGDVSAQAGTLHQLGHLAQAQGDLSKALGYYQQSLDLQKQAGGSVESAVLHQIGTIHQDRGDYDGALAWYEQALELQRASGDNEAMAATLHQVGLVHHAKEDYDQALDYYEQARKLEEELGIKRGLGPTLAAIGLIHLERQQYEKAREHFRRAKTIAEDLSDKTNEAVCHQNLGVVAFETGEGDLARWHFDAALGIREQLGSQLGIAESLYWMAELMREMGDKVTARRHFERAADIYKTCGLPEREAHMRELAAEA